ncbi:MAG: right-handed parallel beta-helix repeat-containing protein [Ruminococcaceae bacterium]|nr:right-handed parallel beta-helix repeat-containing protein [Oscillospiraceae bacterium]
MIKKLSILLATLMLLSSCTATIPEDESDSTDNDSSSESESETIVDIDDNSPKITVEYDGQTLYFKDVPSAQNEVRKILSSNSELDTITVTVPEGTYSNKDFVFTSKDCSPDTKVIWQADGEVIISAGLSVPREEWKDPDDEFVSRFHDDVRQNIKMISLTDYGLTKEDWGEEVAVGTYKMDHLYDDASSGVADGFFIGDQRMVKARYPNTGYNYFNFVDPGDRSTQDNPYGGEYRIDQATADRVRTWADPDCGWIFAFYAYHWAEGTSPVTFNTDTLSLFPKYIAWGSGEVGAGFTPRYYLYNIPEELDSVGEWYLNRETGNLYFWPHTIGETADFYYKSEYLISLNNTKNMEFKGFTLTGTGGNAISATSDDTTFDRLTVKNIGGWGMQLRGWRNTVSNSEFGHLGKGGLDIAGGDEATLTPGENRVTNNYIHNFSEVYTTYQQGLGLAGCGNVADHNEICYSPHAAVSLGGSEQLFEYNYVHDVVLDSTDAGAIYQGGNWTARGTVMRYNIISGVGIPNTKCYPHAFYFDDGMCGQTCYGNIITKCDGYAFYVGGGREIVIKHNIIVDSNKGIVYDDRFRQGILGTGWATNAVQRRDYGMWTTLDYVPYLEEPWRSKYPLLAKYNLSEDPADYDDIDFPCNPSYSEVCENVFIKVNVATENLLRIEDSVYEYSTVKNNIHYQYRDQSFAKAGWDPVAFNLKDDSTVYKRLPDFEKIPVEEIGRQPIED